MNIPIKPFIWKTNGDFKNWSNPKIALIKDDAATDYYIQELELNLEQIEKGSYDHFMLKEIYEQPHAIKDTYRGRLLAEQDLIKMAK